MYIKDVCSKCKLTKKAVEYYEQQGLICPKVLENGYRIYSEEDISILKEIGTLRKIGISIADIKEILKSNNKSAALSKCKYKMNLEVEKSIAKKKCLEQLIKDYNIDYAIEYIEENIEKFFTIKEKLLQSFPGWYGMYLSIHFGQFLNGKIDTEEKEIAYKKIVEYLDKIEGIQLPDGLEEYLVKYLGYLEDEDMQKINNIILDAVNNTEEYLNKNKEDIEKYLEFRNSDEYKNSIAYKMQQLLLKIQQESGYYDIFIENLKILSDSYREYFEKLQAANKIITDKYPQINKMM